MRRVGSSLLVALLLLLGCTAGEAPEPDPDPDPEPGEEATGPSGLRVGVVLPPGDAAAADEVDAAALGLDGIADDVDDVSEIRAVVPDGEPFVADVATLLAEDGYGLVCVVGDDAQRLVLDLAERWVGTDFCALPGDPERDVPDNVVLVQVAVEELGTVVGVALAALAGDAPAEALYAAERTGLDRFRAGVRVGFGAGELREVTGEPADLEPELDEALDGEVAALAFDARAASHEAVERAAATLPTLAPASLLSEEDAALVWRTRWDAVLRAVVAWHLDRDVERPRTVGFAEEVFDVTAGGRSTSTMRAAVETVVGELARGQRDPLEPEEDRDEDVDGAGDGDEEGDDG